MGDGHCLIVPMQHVTCGTQVDEDVWAEIQVCNVTQNNNFRLRSEFPNFKTNI